MKVTVLGAGSMGTAMAVLLSEKKTEICIWARRRGICKDVMESRTNSEYLLSAKLRDNIVCETDIVRALTNADVLVFAIPSHALTEILQQIKNNEALKTTNSNLVSLSVIKGVIHPSGRMFASEEIEHFIGNDVAVFAGPTFASEIAQKILTTATLASKSTRVIDVLKPLLETDFLKVSVTDDIRGVQLCSVLKNIYSIAVGIIDGLGFGDNVRGLFVHYAVDETKRLLPIFGAQTETIFSPAGFGDFIATAFSQKSRNRSLGLLLGLGVIKNRKYSAGILAEGLKTVSAVKKVSSANDISTPIIDFVYSICFDKVLPVHAFRNLQSKLLKHDN